MKTLHFPGILQIGTIKPFTSVISLKHMLTIPNKLNFKTEQSVSPYLACNGKAPAATFLNLNNPGNVYFTEAFDLLVHSRLSDILTIEKQTCLSL